MKKLDPMWLIGLIFGLMGGVFAVIGVAFLVVSADLLPQLLNAEIWLGETPDALALPVIGVVFTVMGVLLALPGVILMVVVRRRRALREELLRYGVRVQGTVTDVRTNYSIRVNGRCPLCIMVQATHPVTGETKRLKGPMVWETTLAPGDAVDVCFDQHNEKAFAVVLPGSEAC